MTEKPIFEGSLDSLLKALDAAPTGHTQGVLKDSDDKQYYETIVMFAVRRRAAAKYHLDSVTALLKKEAPSLDAMAKELANKHGGDLKVVGYSAASLRSAQEFVHELSAFLAALRSGVDFIARIAMRSLPGINGDSISSLIKAVQKGRYSGPLLDEVKQHLDWLFDLKEYRDEIVHRMVIAAPVSGWHISHKGKTSTQVLPVVVPRHTPKKFLPDTRLARMLDRELPHGLSLHERHGTVTYPDGTVEVLDHSVRYLAADGFVAIETFMFEHLASYDNFVGAMLEALTALNFNHAKISKS